MAFEPYITGDDLKAWTQVAGVTKDAIIDDIVAAASRQIDQFCGRHFWQEAAVIRGYDATSSCVLSIDDAVTVDAITTDDNDDGVHETVWAAADYQVVAPAQPPRDMPARQIRAVGALSFPVGGRHARRVGVSATWGWPDVPEEVRMACRIRSAALLTRMQSPNGVAGVGDFGPIRADRPEDRDVVALLHPYRTQQAAVPVA